MGPGGAETASGHGDPQASVMAADGMAVGARDFGALNECLRQQKWGSRLPREELPVGNLLLTGATGFLGAHILAEFLEHDEGQLYCLVRGADEAAAEAHLNTVLSHYYGAKYHHSPRLHIICGDMAKPDMGLSPLVYGDLVGQIATVINCAANVKHIGKYETFYRDNVESVKNLLAFCRHSRARLLHLSTTSVSGSGLHDQFAPPDLITVFDEETLYSGPPHDNVYVRSKVAAEEEVVSSILAGQKANIIRVGNLTNRLSDGCFQPNYVDNGFLQRLKAVYELGGYPDYLDEMMLEMTPVDLAARAVMTIARHFNMDSFVYHVAHNHPPVLGQLAELAAKSGLSLPKMPADAFAQRLKSDLKAQQLSTSAMALINYVDADYHIRFRSPIVVDTQKTSHYLANFGFEWPSLGYDYFSKYFNYFSELGFIKVTKNAE